jgi:hypothetical protein
MISWEEYIKAQISEFRKDYEQYPAEIKAKIVRNPDYEDVRSLAENPTQFIVLDFVGSYPKCFIIVHLEDHSDMEVLIIEDVKPRDFADLSKKPPLSTMLSTKDIERITDFVVSFPKGKGSFSASFSSLEQCSFLSYRDDPRTSAKFPFPIFPSILEVRSLLAEYTRRKQTEEIEETVNDIKKDAEAIPIDTKFKKRFIEKTERLDNQIKQLHNKVEEEITAVRKLVGSTESIKEWKLLISDVDRLKGEHVPREVLESKLEGLSTKIEALEKIEKAYERLSSQQEKVLEQQSSFLKWIKYSIILVPIAVACVPIIEALIRHSLGAL